MCSGAIANDLPKTSWFWYNDILESICGLNEWNCTHYTKPTESGCNSVVIVLTFSLIILFVFLKLCVQRFSAISKSKEKNFVIVIATYFCKGLLALINTLLLSKLNEPGFGNRATVTNTYASF